MIDIKLHHVQSSSLAAVGYDTASRTLAVQFAGKPEGRVYHYHGVSTEDHLAMLAAPSVGSHFVKHIKDKFPSTRK